jgi:hypothetical protein
MQTVLDAINYRFLYLVFAIVCPFVVPIELQFACLAAVPLLANTNALVTKPIVFAV